MTNHRGPDTMTAGERIREIGEILSIGIRRLQARADSAGNAVGEARSLTAPCARAPATSSNGAPEIGAA